MNLTTSELIESSLDVPNEAPEANEPEFLQKLIAVGSGKGGTGKSTFAINLSCALAAMGHEVVLVDADLGGMDIANLLGREDYEYTLNSFIAKEVESLEEVLEKLPSPHLKLISGGSEIVTLASTVYQQRMRLIRSIQQLQAEYIVVDLGPDTGLGTLDFFNAASIRFLVTQNADPIIMGTYRFLKAAFIRQLKKEFKDCKAVIDIINTHQNRDAEILQSNLNETLRQESPEINAHLDRFVRSYQPKLVFNMVKNSACHKTADRIFTFILEKYGFRLRAAGFIPYEKDVELAYAHQEPAILRFTRGPTAQAMFEVMKTADLNVLPGGKKVDGFVNFMQLLTKEAENWKFAKY